VVQDERGKKYMQTDRSGGDASEPEGRVLQRNRKHSANHWGSLGLARHSRGAIAYILSGSILQLVDTLMARL
jgi:hypothetical protein